MDIESNFKNKKVLQMGLGLLGRAVGDAEFIAKNCHPKEFIVTDLKKEGELKSSLERLKDLDIKFKLGAHDEQDFENAEVVLKAAGIPLNSPFIEKAKKAGAQILMSTAISAKYAQDLGVQVVGVTGTRGKSTITHMIYHALKMHIKDKQIFLGGNERGVSTLALTPEFKEGDILVLELDSWQLQGFSDLKISPNIAIFSNLYPDHLNYYPDMQSYFNDKANIFKYQKLERGDLLIVGEQLPMEVQPPRERRFNLHELHDAPVVFFVASRLPEEWRLQIPGEHNRYNASLALEALSQLGLSIPQIKEALESFEGVEGRLQYLKDISEKLGVQIYNDNNSTTPKATEVALDTLAKDKKNSKLILIAGGADKGLPLEGLAKKINENVDKLFLLKNTGTEKLKKLLQIEFEEFDSLKDATRRALRAARKGDILLFSPAFASFSHEFKNEYERDDAFNEIITEFYAK